MNICVTGGAGFIGSEIVRQLVAAQHEVLVIDSLTYAGDLFNLMEVRGKIQFFQVDINDKQEIKEVFNSVKVDLIINCAAETHVDNSISDPGIFFQTNILGTYNLLEIARTHSIKFLQVSTDEVYGSKVEGEFSEDSILNPSSPYSASKASAEMLVNSYISTYNSNALIVRCSNNYGPHQFPEKLIPVFLSKLISGGKVPLYGNGANIREWIHVSDSAKGIIDVALQGKRGDIFNISSSDFRSNIEVTKLLLSILGKTEEQIEYVADRPGHDFRYAIDSSKIRRILSWQPLIRFDEGLRSTVEWYLANPNFLTKKGPVHV